MVGEATAKSIVTQLYHEVTTKLFGDSMGLRAQNSYQFSIDLER